ncbi:MAG: alpha/beta fold hydrolase [Verrucomicrobiota bacterium]
MPVISQSSYVAPWYALGAHGQTILPNVTRRRIRLDYRRERFELPDGDFVDVDWAREEGERCVLAIHGLEGSSEAPYMKSILRSLSKAGYAAAALNLRGCGGEPNRLLRSYHSGSSDDLRSVVEELYRRFGGVYLVGFSLGGNITLKYLGEEGASLDTKLKAGVAISVPCDLASSAEVLGKWSNAFYMKRFMTMLTAKVREKAARFPGELSAERCKGMRTFGEFDDAFTAPMNGFADAEDYWKRASSKPLLWKIGRPALLINAVNDPFLPDECYPIEEAKGSDWFHLEMPRAGGHCGFPGTRSGEGYWIERRVMEFFGGG